MITPPSLTTSIVAHGGTIAVNHRFEAEMYRRQRPAPAAGDFLNQYFRLAGKGRVIGKTVDLDAAPD